MAPVSAKQRTQSSVSAPAPSGPPWILIVGVLAVTAIIALALLPTGETREGGAAPPTAVADAGGMASEPDGNAEPAELPERAAAPPAPANPTPVPSADAAMPPLPLVSNMVPRSPELIREAYTFAAQNPDVLEYVPCFCGCETAGHRGNADCFVESRNTDGSVQTWDTHGMACTICIDVARDAMQLHASGASVQDIRASVESKYAQYPRQTPTPTPPH